VNARGEAFHFILDVKLHFFQSDFFDEVFGIEVGRLGEFLEFGFILLMLFGQTLVLRVCLENYVPRAPLRCRHAYLLGWIVNTT
jgi:hypothetical protein